AGALLGLAGGALGGLLAAPGDLQRRLGRGLGQLARHQVVAQVAGRDVDNRSAFAERVDVLQQDRLWHRSVAPGRQPSRSRSRSPRPPRPCSAPSTTYGSSASSRARLTARATWLWWRRHAPVMRRERILPRSEMNRRSIVRSL